jgi:DNA-binding NtrC family response regulator
VNPNGPHAQNGRTAAVVIVDDEDMVITSIKAFLQLETDFDVRGYNDPQEAAAYVSANTVDVVVTDYLMPKMNGIQLLAKVKETQPETSRVLLTGHADKQSAIQAINEVSLFQYLEKPWDNAQLLLVVQSGAERARLLRDLREKVDELDSANSTLKEVQRRLIKAFL